MTEEDGRREASRLAKNPDGKNLKNTLKTHSVKAAYLEQRKYTQSQPSFRGGGGGEEEGEGGGGGGDKIGRPIMMGQKNLTSYCD